MSATEALDRVALDLTRRLGPLVTLSVPLIAALCKVLERHYSDEDETYPLCAWCQEDWPCAEVEDIEDALTCSR